MRNQRPVFPLIVLVALGLLFAGEWREAALQTLPNDPAVMTPLWAVHRSPRLCKRRSRAIVAPTWRSSVRRRQMARGPVAGGLARSRHRAGRGTRVSGRDEAVSP